MQDSLKIKASVCDIQGTFKILQDHKTGPTLTIGQFECKKALFAAHHLSGEYPCMHEIRTHGNQTILFLRCISLAEPVHTQELENVLRVGTRIAGAMAK